MLGRAAIAATPQRATPVGQQVEHRVAALRGGSMRTILFHGTAEHDREGSDVVQPDQIAWRERQKAPNLAKVPRDLVGRPVLHRDAEPNANALTQPPTVDAITIVARQHRYPFNPTLAIPPISLRWTRK